MTAIAHEQACERFKLAIVLTGPAGEDPHYPFLLCLSLFPGLRAGRTRITDKSRALRPCERHSGD
jgi:hypothetical protein